MTADNAPCPEQERGTIDRISRIGLLTDLLDRTYGRLRKRLDGLTDDEFFWQPVADAWTIFEDRPGHWTYNYAIPDPDPAPVTTIGWQIVHLATCKLMYHEWAYGPAKLTWPDLTIPHTAPGAMALLDAGQALLRADLLGLGDDDLDLPRGTNWGEVWPASRIFTVLIDHDALHGGAIGQMRDLYYWSHRT